jgi:gephyrin
MQLHAEEVSLPKKNLPFGSYLEDTSDIQFYPFNLNSAMNVDSPISVEEAIRRVLLHTSSMRTEQVTLSPDLLGRVIAENIVARENFPPFAASIMDGYAVVAPLTSGVFPVVESIHAGAVPATQLQTGQVAYITTGAALPAGANAVVKIEDTSKVGDGKESVQINVSVKEGAHVRQIGSDIALGEVVINKGQSLGPYELGVLATTGFTSVLCYAAPVVGVMSTGSELVDPWETPIGAQVRDSNRLSLIAACREGGQQVVDLGIVPDNKEELRLHLLEAADRCDVVVSSGGVSMGAADFVKPLLKEIGTVHFAKLNMKPGKPTTFASFQRRDSSPRPGKQVLFFGLPGNPVSCLVTKALFVDVALRRLQGLDSEACCHPQLTVTLASGRSGVAGGEEGIQLDPERPEYHRAILVNDTSSSGSGSGTGRVLAYSTGVQRSSRLLSMLSANALLFLPQASEGRRTIPVGATLQALLIRPLTAAPRAASVHPSAAALDFPDPADEEEVAADGSGGGMKIATSASAATAAPGASAVLTVAGIAGGDYVSFPRKGSAEADTAALAAATAAATPAVPSALAVVTDPTAPVARTAAWQHVRVGLLTISDRVRVRIYPS